jgi:hypothetical protein
MSLGGLDGYSVVGAPYKHRGFDSNLVDRVR